MRRLALVLLAAAVLLIPQQPAEAIGFSSGDLDPGTRVLMDLRTDGFPRIKLDARLADDRPGDIFVGDTSIGLLIPVTVRKPLVRNVMLPAPGLTISGGLVIDKLTEKKASHKIPWLSTLPVLGDLFRQDAEAQMSALLIALTPTIVEDPEGKKPKEVDGYAGAFRIDDAKGRGSVRIVKNFTKYKGSWTWQIRGSWLDGPAAGKTFKATLKGKLKGTRQ